MLALHRHGDVGQEQRQRTGSVRDYVTRGTKTRVRLSRSPYNMASIHVGPSETNYDDTYDRLETDGYRSSAGSTSRRNGQGFIGYIRDTFRDRRPLEHTGRDVPRDAIDASSRSKPRSKRRRSSSRRRHRNASAHTHYRRDREGRSSDRSGRDASRDMTDASSRSRPRSRRRRSSSRRRHRNASVRTHYSRGSGRSSIGSNGSEGRHRSRRWVQFRGRSSRGGEYTHAARSGRVRGRRRGSSRRRGPRAGGHEDRTSFNRDSSLERAPSDLKQNWISKGSGASSREKSQSLGSDSFSGDDDDLRPYERVVSAYTVPPPLSAEPDLNSIKVEGTSPTFIESLGTFIPLRRLLEPVPRVEAIREDKLLHTRGNTFGDGPLWHSDSRSDYAKGDMYTSAPPKGALAWKRTAKQAHALILCLGRDALRSAVVSGELNQKDAIIFLITSALELAVRIHKGGFSKFGRAKLLSSLPRVPTGDAKMFEGGAIRKAKGPAAAILRASYGSLAYWPELRCILGSKCKSAVRYAAAAMLRAEVFLLSRVSSDTVSVTKEELEMLSSCVTVGCVAASIAAQFLYVSSGRMLHRFKANRVRAWARLLGRGHKKLPMESLDVLYAEGMCLGRLESASYGTGGAPLGETFVGAYVATRSALTELMNEFVSRSTSANERDIESGDTLTATVVATTIVLQRLLGHLNIGVAHLTIAAMYHDLAVDVWSETFKLYRHLCYVCKGLYRPVSVDEYIADRDDAMEYLELEFERGDPPDGIATAIRGEEKNGELEALKLVPPPSGYNLLGTLASLQDVLEDAKEAIFKKTDR